MRLKILLPTVLAMLLWLSVNVAAARQPVGPTHLLHPVTGDYAIAQSQLPPLGELTHHIELLQQSQTHNLDSPSTQTASSANYAPREEVAWVHPTNYGDRYAQDVYGRPVSNDWIVVIHETVSSAASTISYFQTPHYREEDQASYHALIRLNGTIVYLVPPEKRAFGAGNSVFNGFNGPEAVKTHPKFSASVNNFAYHIAFETPTDGRNNAGGHSGYTDAQYKALAWLVALTNVPDDRITTHKAVDRSGERRDPRSFSQQKFIQLLHTYNAAAPV